MGCVVRAAIRYSQATLSPFQGLSIASKAQTLIQCQGISIKDWDIEEFEYHHKDNGIHWTLYRQFTPFPSLAIYVADVSCLFFGDSGYYLTPADGSGLKGQCRRVSDDDFDFVSVLDRTTGVKLFEYTSEHTYDDVNWVREKH